MKHYAIGKPGQQARMIMSTMYEDAATLNCQPDEVAVEIENLVGGTIGIDGESFTVAGIDIESEKSKIRERRTALLAQSDWVMFPDSPVTGSLLEQWMEYRQALRDILSEQVGKTFNQIIWPATPS